VSTSSFAGVGDTWYACRTCLAVMRVAAGPAAKGCRRPCGRWQRRCTLGGLHPLSQNWDRTAQSLRLNQLHDNTWLQFRTKFECSMTMQSPIPRRRHATSCPQSHTAPQHAPQVWSSRELPIAVVGSVQLCRRCCGVTGLPAKRTDR